ncbi:condensin-2 complex subunit G2 [Nilaparvata lugens]|uniref:condensin-2 complex subunit G2 n=1 Tax=Nilaparvata lugens TaxID=108931 RepID=UPI00193E45B1|nr:condensin-2 complex subunit G2 [Nilaparvata lugens]
MAENKKHSDCIALLLEKGDLPPYAKNLLTEKKEQLGENVRVNDLSFEVDEISKLSSSIYPLLKSLLVKVQEDEEATRKISLIHLDAIISLIDLLMMKVPEESMPPETLMNNVGFLNKLLSMDLNIKIKNKISRICELCCYKRCRLSTDFVKDTLTFLLKYALDTTRQVPVQDVKRLWKIHESIKSVNYKSPDFIKLLLLTVRSNDFISYKEGQQFIAFLFNLDSDMIKSVHEAIKEYLPFVKKTQAASFGKIYHLAWTNSEDERQFFEKYCIQDLMSRIFELNRATSFMEMSILGKNVLAILSVLHSSRKLVHLSKIITDLYKPLIWRHLRSGNNIIRCNATEVFLDVYPLEMPGASRSEQKAFLERQHDEMADLLVDNCHVVRILAVKGICNSLRNFWATFGDESIRKIMTIIVNDLINDGSTPEVRKAVYKGFTRMLTNPPEKGEPFPSAEYLAKVLPRLKAYIHDESEKVRKAFVEMLIQVKKIDLPSLKYWEIATAEHLLARLELEKEDVSKPLVHLIMSEFFTNDKPMTSVLKRICKIITMNKLAARKLFLYSKKYMEFDLAVELILSILTVLRNRLKEIEENHAKTIALNKERKKRRRVGSVLTEKNSNDNNASSNDSMSSLSSKDSSCSSAERESMAPPPQQQTPHHLDNVEVSHAFIDIVTILWSSHGEELSQPQNAKHMSNIQDMTALCVPQFIKHFKGTDSFYATIHLASNVPLSKLTGVTTISSMCMSQLKSMSSESRDAEMEVYINALCAWNRGPDLLELVTDWLDQAFRLQSLNQSAAVRSSAKRRKVKFQNGDANPLQALKVLDMIFSSLTNSTRIMKKYAVVHELYIFLERIKTLIEKRIDLQSPYPDEALTDNFMELCLYRYAKLILLLHKESHPDTTRDTENRFSTASRDADNRFSTTNRDSETGASIENRPSTDSRPSTGTRASTDIRYSSQMSLNDHINQVEGPCAFIDLIKWANRVLIPAVQDANCNVSQLAVKLVQVLLKTCNVAVSINYVNTDMLHTLINFADTVLNTDHKTAFIKMTLKLFQLMSENCLVHREKDEEKFLRVYLTTLFDKIVLTISERRTGDENILDHIPSISELRRCLISLPHSLILLFGAKSPTLQNVLNSLIMSAIEAISYEMEQMNSLCPVEKIKSLPGVSSYLVDVLLWKENLFAVALNKLSLMITTKFYDDSNHLLAATSLLYTLSFINKQKIRQLLISPTKSCYQCIKKFKADEEETDKKEEAPVAEDTMNTSKLIISLDVQKAGESLLKDICKRLECTLE